MSTRGLAIDVRHTDSGALIGVALVVPSQRYLAVLADGAQSVREPRLAEHAWLEVDAWATAGDAGLPARPSPLNPDVAAVLFVSDQPVIARRFASVPIGVTSHLDLAPLAERVLPQLLNARRSAA
ncbi:MAG TPA: hypothetical protein VHI99_20845 [Vicinamibacterales bacterium]|jgi:hypothetical protein|nr:hypothetical protein [Vicinamibacterales bacterium]